MASKTNPAHISIGKWGRYGEPKPIRIAVADESSGVQIIEVHLSLEKFAEALTGRGDCDCEAEVFDTFAYLGSTYEHKREKVYVGEEVYRNFTDEEATALLAPLDVDGWRGRLEDLNNHHNSGKDEQGAYYEVHFGRHVDAEGKPISQGGL